MNGDGQGLQLSGHACPSMSRRRQNAKQLVRAGQGVCPQQQTLTGAVRAGTKLSSAKAARDERKATQGPQQIPFGRTALKG